MRETDVKDEGRGREEGGGRKGGGREGGARRGRLLAIDKDFVG